MQFFSHDRYNKENRSALPCMHCNPAYDDDELCNASQQQQQQQLTSSVLRKTIRATAGGLLQPIEARNQMMARQERLLMSSRQGSKFRIPQTKSFSAFPATSFFFPFIAR